MYFIGALCEIRKERTLQSAYPTHLTHLTWFTWAIGDGASVELAESKRREERITRVRNSARNEVIALTLRELREEAGLTQVEVSKLADMTQSALSRLERREDNPIPALRQYVEALGGELELVAILGRKRIKLVGV